MLIGKYAKYTPIANHNFYVQVVPSTNQLKVINDTVAVAFISSQLHPGVHRKHKEDFATLLLQINIKKMFNFQMQIKQSSLIQYDDISESEPEPVPVKINKNIKRLGNYYHGWGDKSNLYIDNPELCIYKMLYFFYLIANNLIKRSALIVTESKPQSSNTRLLNVSDLHLISNGSILLINEDMGCAITQRNNWVSMANYCAQCLSGQNILESVASLSGVDKKIVDKVLDSLATILSESGSTALLAGASKVTFNIPQLFNVDIKLNSDGIPYYTFRTSPMLNAGLRTYLKPWMKNYWKD